MSCRPVLLGIAAWLLAGCSAQRPETVTLYAAVSTREALEELAANFRAQAGLEVVLNFGPSSELARQIEHGGAADLYLPADEDWADYLAKKGLVNTKRDLLSNRLVVVVPAESKLAISRLSDLAGLEVHRLALAGPAVPAGRYAREALRTAGVWEQLEGRVLDGSDVRVALAYVMRGEAEAGVVYATDTRGNSKVRVALEVPAELHPPIRYPLVLVRREPVRAGARRLFDYLASEEAAAVFRRAGFGTAAE